MPTKRRRPPVNPNVRIKGARKKEKENQPKWKKFIGLIGVGVFVLIVGGAYSVFTYMNYISSRSELEDGQECWAKHDISGAYRHFHNSLVYNVGCADCLIEYANFNYIENNDEDLGYELINKAFEETSEDEQTSFMYELRGKCLYKKHDATII